MRIAPTKSPQALSKAGWFGLNFFLIILPCIVVCGGCKTISESRYAIDAVSSSELEIRSKTFKDAQGQVIGCLRWEVANPKCPGPLLLVQYGDLQTRVPTCIEFYRIMSCPATSVAVYDTVKEKMLQEKRQIPCRTNFVLIGKDYDQSVVKNAEVLDGGDSASIAVTRQSPSYQKKARQTALYFIKYNKDFTISRDVHTWISNLPDEN